MDTAPRILECDQSWEKWKGMEVEDQPPKRVYCYIGGVAFSVDTFEATHPHIKLAEE